MGDFNAHLGFIGEQETNYNGQLVLDFMTERNFKDSWYIIPAQGYISSVCPTYTVQHFDFTTFPLLFIVMGIINKRKSPTPLASKESSENN